MTFYNSGVSILSQLTTEIRIFVMNAQTNFIPVMKILSALWAVNILHWLSKNKLNALGIYPRQASGIIGIFFSWIPHQNFNHLFFNSIPLFALLLFMTSFGWFTFWFSSIMIIILGGLAVWLFGRKACHIGASGVILGFFGYVLASAYLHPTFTTFFLALVALYYFGSMLLSIFPTQERVSWESHLLGLIAGIATLYLYPHVVSFLAS